MAEKCRLCEALFLETAHPGKFLVKLVERVLDLRLELPEAIGRLYEMEKKELVPIRNDCEGV